MANDETLRQAIAAARGGQKLAARSMLLEVVRTDPQNETAWMWLSGLYDDPDDCIDACDRVLAINPGNAHIRAYREKLLTRKQDAPLPPGKAGLEQRLREVQQLVDAKKFDQALLLVRDLNVDFSSSVAVWALLARLSPDLDEKIGATENILLLEPQNAQAQQELKRLYFLSENPFELGIFYEEQGDFDRANQAYEIAAEQAKTRQDFDAVYERIRRLENLQKEKIVHISPNISVARLSAGPPLLYLGLLLVQVGINPLADPEPLLWVGLLWVILGGFLVAMAAVHSYHPLWEKIFKDVSAGRSRTARFILGSIGWALVLIPHLILLGDALARLRLLQQALAW